MSSQFFSSKRQKQWPRTQPKIEANIKANPNIKRWWVMLCLQTWQDTLWFLSKLSIQLITCIPGHKLYVHEAELGSDRFNSHIKLNQNPGHISGRQVVSSLYKPYSLKISYWFESIKLSMYCFHENLSFCQNQIKTYLQEVEKAAQKRDREGNLLESKPSK